MPDGTRWPGSTVSGISQRKLTPVFQGDGNHRDVLDGSGMTRLDFLVAGMTRIRAPDDADARRYAALFKYGFGGPLMLVDQKLTPAPTPTTVDDGLERVTPKSRLASTLVAARPAPLPPSSPEAIPDPAEQRLNRARGTVLGIMHRTVGLPDAQASSVTDPALERITLSDAEKLNAGRVAKLIAKEADPASERVSGETAKALKAAAAIHAPIANSATPSSADRLIEDEALLTRRKVPTLKFPPAAPAPAPRQAEATPVLPLQGGIFLGTELSLLSPQAIMVPTPQPPVRPEVRVTQFLETGPITHYPGVGDQPQAGQASKPRKSLFQQCVAAYDRFCAAVHELDAPLGSAPVKPATGTAVPDRSVVRLFKALGRVLLGIPRMEVNAADLPAASPLSMLPGQTKASPSLHHS